MARQPTSGTLDKIFKPVVAAELNWSKPGRAPKKVVPEEPPKLVIEFGGPLSFDTFYQSSTTMVGIWGSKNRSEIERQYDEVRVSSPDNPDQYLDAEVVTKITHGVNVEGTFVKQGDITYQQLEATENVEILSRGNKRRVPEA